MTSSPRGRRIATLLATMLTAVTMPVALAATPAHAAASGPTTVPCSSTGTTCVVTQSDNVDGCMGVRTTPGSENTDKRLVGGTLEPGGTAEFLITYPVDPTDANGRTTFVITDCVFVDGNPILKYDITYVPNTADALLSFTLNIPSTVNLGSTYCNYAKTTAAPSASQASNRKAGPACFVVGGNVRIEKRDAVTHDLLAGATFEVSCTPTTDLPPTVINFIGATDAETTSYTNSGGPLALDVTDVATTGVITINGPSGTPCTVTETKAPAGYDLADPASQSFTIDASQVQTFTFDDQPQVGSLVITKNADAPGTFKFDVDCGTGSAANGTYTVIVGADGTASTDPITGIPVGTSCTVTEESNPDFTVTSDNPQTITIAEGTNTVTFTNTRNTGSLVITKDADAPGTFKFDVDCGTGSAANGTYTVIVGADGTASTDPITGIPTGTVCTVTEESNPDFTVSGDNPQQITIQSGTNTVTFTNTRNTGSLVITKNADAPGTFKFDVDCGTGSAANGTYTIVVGADGTASTDPITGIPTGTQCTVTEESNPDFTVSGDNPQTITIAEGTNTVTFTNVRNTGSLTITKSSDTPGTFVFDVSCTDGTTATVTIDVPVQGEPVTGTPVSGIQTGAVCTIHEETQAGFLPQDDQTITIHDGDNAVEFANVGRTYGLGLVKAVDATTAAPGDVLTYSFTATTSGNSPQTDVVVMDTLPAGVTYVDGSATCAAPCTATYDPTLNRVTWSLGDLDANTTVSGLTYQVTVDPTTTEERIRNTGVIESTEVGAVTSNQVVTRVFPPPLPVHVTKPPVVQQPQSEPAVLPAQLPFTGAEIADLLGIGTTLTASGIGFQAAAGRRRRRYRPRHAA